MKVAIIGPNLTDQTKGTFHVHTEDCGDRRHYGPEGRFGGEDNGWVIDVEKSIDIVWAIYADHLAERGETDEEQAATAEDWLSDFWFAPCIGKDDLD